MHHITSKPLNECALQIQLKGSSCIVGVFIGQCFLMFECIQTFGSH